MKMKSYKRYLAESEKKYGFRIKLACEVNDECMDKITRSVSRWNLEAISEPKRLPIAEQQQGFGHLHNIELSMVDVVLNYPCTPQEVQAAISEMTEIPLSHIMVLTPQQEVLASPIVPESDEPLLTSEYPEQKAPQLLADLANALKMSNIEMPFAVKPTKGKTTNELPQNNRGPFSRPNKLPKPLTRSVR
jgi:hypothetical protein